MGHNSIRWDLRGLRGNFEEYFHASSCTVVNNAFCNKPFSQNFLQPAFYKKQLSNKSKTQLSHNSSLFIMKFVDWSSKSRITNMKHLKKSSGQLYCKTYETFLQHPLPKPLATATSTRKQPHNLLSSSVLKPKYESFKLAANYMITIIQTGRKLRKVSCKILGQHANHSKNQNCCNFLQQKQDATAAFISFLVCGLQTLWSKNF